MAVDRRHGRGAELDDRAVPARYLHLAVSFLPGYAQIGVSSLYLLGILRRRAGRRAGRRWDGLASLLALNAPIERRGSTPPSRSSGAARLHRGRRPVRVLPGQPVRGRFPGVGWRYPFFCAFAVNVVALFARLRLVATNEFARLLEQGGSNLAYLPADPERMRPNSIGALDPRSRASRCSTSSPCSRIAGSSCSRRGRRSSS